MLSDIPLWIGVAFLTWWALWWLLMTVTTIYLIWFDERHVTHVGDTALVRLTVTAGVVVLSPIGSFMLAIIGIPYVIISLLVVTWQRFGGKEEEFAVHRGGAGE